ncbi:hypothetical protein SDC9_163317 [bioreactor metagenome]|uniref:Uncharacterized protein n=1 Tax=bioreactor metagenome TaxID=1076179 RepID=A0A645FNJ2_9ZZZZ
MAAVGRVGGCAVQLEPLRPELGARGKVQQRRLLQALRLAEVPGLQKLGVRGGKDLLAAQIRAGRARPDRLAVMDGEIEILLVEIERRRAGGDVDDGAGNEKRRNLARTAAKIVVVGIFDHRQTADAGPDIDTNALCIGIIDLDSRITDRLNAGRHAVMDEDIHSARFLGRQISRNVEILHLASNARSECAGIETGDRGDAALTGNQVFPSFGNSIADRRDESQTGDDDSTTRHGHLRKESRRRNEDHAGQC